MIDVWLITFINILVLIMVFHTYLAYVIAKGKDASVLDPKNSKLFTVRPVSVENDEQKKSSDDVEEKYIKKARFLNNCAKVVFIAFLIVFNVIFWTVAFAEYAKGPDHYITDP